MSTILGNSITLGGGGAKLNIDFGTTPPSDTSKLWVPLANNPDSIECSPVLNYGSEIVSTTSYSFPQNRASTGFHCAAVGKYIYMVGGIVVNNYTNNIVRFNTETGELEVVYTMSSAWYAGTVCAIGDKLYCLGGSPARTFVFDTSNNTLTNLSAFPDNYSYYCSCAEYNGYIYVCGGLGSGNMMSNTVRIYNIAANSYEIWNTGYSRVYTSAAIVADKLYIFCGKDLNNMLNKVLIFDITSRSLITDASLVPSDGGTYCCSAPCVVYGQYIYIICTSVSNGSGPFKVIRFDTSTNTGTVVTTQFPNAANGAYFGFIGNKLWVLGGQPAPNATATTNTIKTFTINTPLQQNHLFLQADFGFDNPFPIVNDGKTKITTYLRNAYLGDSNNIAQLTDAYLYDSDSATWKSLDGGSMTADMLTALATLGVT